MLFIMKLIGKSLIHCLSISIILSFTHLNYSCTKKGSSSPIFDKIFQSDEQIPKSYLIDKENEAVVCFNDDNPKKMRAFIEYGNYKDELKKVHESKNKACFTIQNKIENFEEFSIYAGDKDKNNSQKYEFFIDHGRIFEVY